MRAKTNQMDGNYYTLDQCAYLDRVAQGALFAFNDEDRGCRRKSRQTRGSKIATNPELTLYVGA